MSRHQTELTYQRAAVQNATSIGLVIILFDMLIGDLKRAIAAMAENNVECRSKELKHAFLVLDQMEASLDMENGGQTAASLSRFYSVVRSNVMNGHIKASPEILDQQIQLLFEVREAWAQVNSRNPSSPVASAAPVSSDQDHQEPAGENQTLAMSWSA